LNCCEWSAGCYCCSCCCLRCWCYCCWYLLQCLFARHHDFLINTLRLGVKTSVKFFRLYFINKRLMDKNTISLNDTGRNLFEQ